VAPANNTTADIGVFGATLPDGVTTFQPSLTASRNINGLIFQSPTGGWTLGGGTGFTLTVGGSASTIPPTPAAPPSSTPMSP